MTVDAVILDARFGEVVRSEPFDDEYRSRRLAWVSGLLDDRHEGWETPSLAAKRFQAAIDDLDGDLVIATHGMVMTAWLTARDIVGPAARAAEYWSRLKFPHVQQVTLP